MIEHRAAISFPLTMVERVMNIVAKFSFLAVVVVALVVVLRADACPNKEPSNAQCPVLSAYIITPCSSRSSCDGTMHVVETNKWGDKYRYCNHITEQGGDNKLCYSSANCILSTTGQECMTSTPTEYSRAINKNEGLCDNPECTYISPP